MPKESKSKKSGGRLKFAKIDIQEVLKDVPVPVLPVPAAPLPDEASEQVYDPRLTELAITGAVPATPSPVPAAGTADSAGPQGAAPPPSSNHDYVPMTLLAAVQVDRMREATNGLLKEPGPPPPGIPRVTKEGESSPPMPTELMQLLTA